MTTFDNIADEIADAFAPTLRAMFGSNIHVSAEHVCDGDDGKFVMFNTYVMPCGALTFADVERIASAMRGVCGMDDPCEHVVRGKRYTLGDGDDGEAATMSNGVICCWIRHMWTNGIAYEIDALVSDTDDVGDALAVLHRRFGEMTPDETEYAARAIANKFD